jgi:hypothetical protein
MEVAFWLLLSLGIAIFFWLCWRNIQRSRHERINSFLTAVLAMAALMAGHGTTWATKKTVTYTFTAEKVDGQPEAMKLTFTPSGARFGTAFGAKTVTIPSTSSTTGFTVELDDGVILTFSRNPGYMTFSSSGEIILNYSGYNNSRFTVACTDYYIRHVKFADKSGYAFYGIGTPAPTSNALLDVDVNIDKAGNNYDPSKCYQVNSVSGSPTFGSITITLADFASGNGSKEDPYTIRYTSDLDHLATFVNNGQDYSGVYFVLSNDIAYSHSKDWNFSDDENNYTAIGTYEHPFKGTFDGQGYTVSGIRIYKEYTTSNHYMDYGLFGVVGEGGTVKRVNLADAHITGYCDVGGIAGRAYKSTIEDCSVGNDVWIHAQQNSANDQGGIVGCSLSSTVRRCISRATLAIKSGLTGCSNFGGIVGKNNTKIIDCIAIGVIIPNVNGRGAIVGYSYGDNALTRNYYRDCKVASNNVTPTGVGVGKYNSATTSDPSGALALYAITLGTDVTLDRTVKATLPNTNNKTNKTYANGADIEDQPYAYATATVSLGYSGVTSSGYEVVYSTTGGTVDGNTLTMPTSDVTVTATVAYRLYEDLGITNAIATEIAGKPAIFSRTFSKDVASTICLPFSMTSITGGTVYKFVGIEYDNTINAWVATMSNATNNVTATEANKPYLFLPSADGEVTFMGTAASPIAANSTTSGDWTFHGTFQQLTYGTDPMTGYVYGLASTAATVEGQAVQAGEFVHAIDGAGVPPFRCYLTYNNNGGQFAGTRSGGEAPSRIIVRLIGGDGETTKIMSIDNGEWTIDNWAGEWYSLDGRKLQGKPTKKGLYIHNGRKEVLK